MLVGLVAESPATATTPPPTTSVLVPATGATLSGTAATLDASASNATSVEFWILGGSYGFTGKMIGTATLTLYGWVSTWNTSTVPNGSYVLLSEAFGAGGSAFSAGVSITVNNASWPQLHYGPDRTGYQPNESTIGTANVGKLSEVRTYPTNGTPSPPLIANGILYVITNQLYAFDAAGATDCSAAPTSCTPLWTAPAANSTGMTIANGVVFVTDAEGVQAYDAAGSTNCSGTPKVCAPLWQTSTNTGSGPGFSPGTGSPVVANGVLYVPGYGDGLAPNLGGALVAAFDTAGSKGCTVYNGFGDICVPMWTTTGVPESSSNTGSPAIAGGVIYIANSTLYAFDAAGSTDCSGTPKVCAPLWTAATSGGATYSAPAVANGTVYVGAWNGLLYAFDAAGATNCSVSDNTRTCTPLWTAIASNSIGGTPAVANGFVYIVSEDGTLSAFDAAGSKNCSGTVTAKTCTPLWASASGGSGYDTSSSPAVANGVVYFSSTNGGTYGYDAAGSTNCTVSGGITTCAPLWGAVTGYIGGGSPAIVNGVIYINVSGDGVVYAYSL
jgi:outer membrane protein assembly factor BamB